MSKEQFKVFAKKHPELISRVMSGQVTWQKLYELYDIYGDDQNVWKDYISDTKSDTSIKDIFKTIKNVDMDSFQKGVQNLQKTVGLIQNLGTGSTIPKAYEARNIYKSMED